MTDTVSGRQSRRGNVLRYDTREEEDGRGAGMGPVRPPSLVVVVRPRTRAVASDDVSPFVGEQNHSLPCLVCHRYASAGNGRGSPESEEGTQCVPRPRGTEVSPRG